MTLPAAALVAPPALAPAAHAGAPALLDWFGRAPLPDGAPDAPALSQAEWEGVYVRLEAAAAPGMVPPLAAVEAPLASLRPDAPVPVAVADFPVSVADPAVARRLAEASLASGVAPDRAALAAGATPTRAFAAAALLHDQWGRAEPVYRGRTVPYALDERFWLALPGAPRPDAVSLDPGDGGGPRDVPLGGSVTARYPTGDRATVTLRARWGDETRTARFTLAVGGPPAAPPPDDVWTLTGAADPADPGAPPTGRAFVYRAPGHADVVNPVIVAEGFPGGYAADYLYELLNQGDLADALRARGYDLVVLGLDAGWEPIQRSARVAVACVAEARRRTRAPLVVGGVSMGGLVTRYALAWMETHGADHGARVFLTVDTPHEPGAYTCLADQWLAHLLSAASPAAATLSAALDSPANQQFVMRWVRGGDAGPSPLRERFLADLAAVGSWPRRPRRLAVSSGHGRGLDPSEPQASTTGATIMALDGLPFAEARLRELAGDGRAAVVAEGRCAVPAGTVAARLVVASDVSWERVPGGTNDYDARAAAIARTLDCGAVDLALPSCCSVPTVSALALDQHPAAPVPPPGERRSPFDDYACSDANHPHLTITPAVAAWLLDRIGAPPEAPLEAPLEAPPEAPPAQPEPT